MMAHAAAFAEPWSVRHRLAQSVLRRAVALMDGTDGDPARFDALVLAVGRAHDRRAFKDLFDHFAPRVKGYLVRLGARNALAEDLAQEAMLAVWRKAALFDPDRASASTWIFTIARNLRIDSIRKELRPEIDPADPLLQPDGERAPDETVEWAKAEARLRLAIAELPREQSRIIELSFLAEKPHSLIASELGLPLGTVKSRIRLAMARLRLALGDGA
ncbi:MAG TPA: sigma-70 family RNA polymerase sigma factor [Rhizomicrobium sp.]|nr:sigma-70 family RNA polymerase sigma factor [Rhizomicrobium sp.]